MKRIVAILMIVLLLLSACSTATLEGAGKEIEDTIANAADADNKYVKMVKGGYRVDDPSVTYEDAFSAFFGTPRWKYFESTENQDVVEFTGDCTYQDVPVKARIQFVVDEENGTFDATYLAFNEVPQNAITLAAVIEKAFEEARAAGVESGESSLTDTDSDGSIVGADAGGVGSTDPFDGPTQTPSKTLSADTAENLIYAWLEDGHDVGHGYDSYPEYAGVTEFWDGHEAYKFNLMVSAGAWIPVLVDNVTGDMWVDLDESLITLDEYYQVFCSGSYEDF